MSNYIVSYSIIDNSGVNDFKVREKFSGKEQIEKFLTKLFESLPKRNKPRNIKIYRGKKKDKEELTKEFIEFFAK